MMISPIKQLSLAAVLCVMTASSFADSSTGPTVPIEPGQPPATQGVEPNINSDGKIHNDTDIPTRPSVDPHVRGNDTERQGGMNTDGNGPMDNGGDSTTTLPVPQPESPKP